ncbi:MAG: hypothetical protein ACLFNV_06390 [Desulfovibrionales bacterium]
MYWLGFGPVNFLWFSDIALVMTCLALWRENSFLASMAAAGTLLPEVVWSLDFLLHLSFGERVTGAAAYMFDPALPLHLRILSGFHLLLPPVLLWTLHRLGYDQRGWKAQTLLAWIILPISYLASDQEHNVNWVYGPGVTQEILPEPLYVILLMIALPVLIILPTHGLLRNLYPPPCASSQRTERGH